MPHSWKAYELAQKIAQALIESGCVKEKDRMRVRGVIQIVMEKPDKFPVSEDGTIRVKIQLTKNCRPVVLTMEQLKFLQQNWES